MIEHIKKLEKELIALKEAYKKQQRDEYEKQKAAILRRGKIPSYVNTDLDPSDYYEKISDLIDELEEKAAKEPKAEKPRINKGDWVTPSMEYAKAHGRSELKSRYRILTKTVRARDLYTDGNSLAEWGYDP